MHFQFFFLFFFPPPALSDVQNTVAIASIHLPQSAFAQSPSLQSVDNSSGKLQLIVFRNGKLFPITGNTSYLADQGKRRAVATPAVLSKIGKLLIFSLLCLMCGFADGDGKTSRSYKYTGIYFHNLGKLRVNVSTMDMQLGTLM